MRTVSGAVGATIAINAALAPGTLLSKFASTAVIALISAATVAGKAAGKRFAIESANSVMLAVDEPLPPSPTGRQPIRCAFAIRRLLGAKQGERQER